MQCPEATQVRHVCVVRSVHEWRGDRLFASSVGQRERNDVGTGVGGINHMMLVAA